MTHAPARAVRDTIDGTIRVFLAEALVLPTGLLTAAFLSRRLGPEGYGLFTLAAASVMWIEWAITALFAGATIKFVGSADDWRPIGTTVLRLHMITSVGAALLLWLLAVPIALLLNEATLAAFLALFAIDIPIYSLAHAHRNILIGMNGFGPRALASAGRWIVRLVLIVALVQLGLSIQGAILGSIAASVVELAICRAYVRPSLVGPGLSASRLWGYAAALFLYALSLRLFERLDLFVLKALGGTAEQAGLYGAAQNLALVPGIFALSFSPLLIGTLSRTLSLGQDHLARQIGRDAMRAVLWLLPFGGLAAGTAPEIVELVFGRPFLPAAPLLEVLIFGALAVAMISVAAAILTAAGRPAWILGMTLPLPPLALAGHLVAIPAFGAIGAALVTTLLAALSALAAVMAVYWLWRVSPPARTLCLSVALCVMVYVVAIFWPMPGALLLAKLSVISVAIGLAFAIFGEISSAQLAQTVTALRGALRTPRSEQPTDPQPVSGELS